MFPVRPEQVWVGLVPIPLYAVTVCGSLTVWVLKTRRGCGWTLSSIRNSLLLVSNELKKEHLYGDAPFFMLFYSRKVTSGR